MTLSRVLKKSGIVIRQAEKGGGLVMQTREAYLAEDKRLLEDINTYERLSGDPVLTYKTALKTLLDQALAKKVINKHERQFLFSAFPKTLLFYHILHSHKNAANAPGRPIVARMGSLKSNLGCYIDHFLQDSVTQLPLVTDCGHMLKILSNYMWVSWAHLHSTSIWTPSSSIFPWSRSQHAPFTG